jgi:hypothetical protein
VFQESADAIEGTATAHPAVDRGAVLDEVCRETILSKRRWISRVETESFRQRLDEFPLC